MAGHRSETQQVWRTRRPLRWALSLVFCFMALSAVAAAASEAGPSGQTLYARQCARCHGARGEGVEDYFPDPLHGDLTVEQLARVVDRTMPEDDPEQCTGADAEKVARYVHEAFYSEEARERNRPPRIELSHLTARQYVNTVADLVGSFVGQPKVDDRRGLAGRYYNSRRFSRDKMVLERVDPQIVFDFGEGSPDPETISGEEFSVQWHGGLIAEETGDYELFVTTENGARLWINDRKDPLIDAWVRSGDTTEHRGTIRLLGGRAYFLRLNYFKYQDKTASIAIEWKPPGRARGIIPDRNLSPQWFPPVLVVAADFPPDDRSAGYERGTSVSEAWDRATTYAALDVAGRVAENLDALSKSKADDADHRDRVREFCRRFAERAMRRPLSDEQVRFFVDDAFEGSSELDSAVKRVVLLVLKSPRFLYHGIGETGVDDFGVASRLSYGLWDSLPDRQLLREASRGRLRTQRQVAEQARRMLALPAARSRLRDFFHAWLAVGPADEVSKDKELFPAFDEQVASDVRTSLDLFLDDVVWGDASDFRQLLLADTLFVNERLAQFYDVPSPPGDGFHKVACDPERCAGILTHPCLTSGFAYLRTSSPIHRGVFIVRSLVGRTLRPPPVAVAALDEQVDPDLTTRQRVALQTRPVMCQGCHVMINPLGFALEHYDAVGRFREEEKLKPIDASGSYTSTSGDRTQFDGARQLAELLAQSGEVHRAFVERLFHEVVKQPIGAYGPDTLETLTDSFVGNDFDIQELLVEIMKVAALQTGGS